MDGLTADRTVLIGETGWIFVSTLKVDCEVFNDCEIFRKVPIDSEVSEKKLTD